jgi:ABC-type transporter Mla maintaining outer membrane lipid asymmetry ATPase subunit MlaF
MEVPPTDLTAPIPIVTVTANVELQLPLSNVFALFGGSGLGVVTYAVSDSARHYGQ